jgi:hypothetical protein
MTDQAQPTPGLAEYEPPRVEQVLTPAELQREILYAGPPASFPP